MPDWTKEEEYKDLDSRGWAWEFLRRNLNYRAHWLDLSLSVVELVKKYGPLNEWPEKSDQLKGEADAWVGHPLFGTRELLPVAAGRLWSLKCMIDPFASGASNDNFLDGPFPPPLWTKGWEVMPFIGGLEETAPIGIYTWIRVDADIEPQLESLRKELNKLQKEHKVVPPKPPSTREQANELYKGYVRALDGREAGATHGKIGLRLLPHKHKDDSSQTIQDWVEAGTKMVEGGWISLLSKKKGKKKKSKKK